MREKGIVLIGPCYRYASCMTSLCFRRCFDFPEIPNDWKLVRLTLDWAGRPLLLFVEGKPPQPDFHTNTDAWSRWYRTPPKAHHLVYWEAGKPHSVAFDRSQGLSTFHVQPFEGGWLLGERRGGRATLYDVHGAVRSTLDLGDASEDLQTTPDGRIWISYFDEGVFGGGIGRQSLVCFDATGAPLFKYADFAEQNALPMICDCYAMNVDETGAVWLNYYTDFPLVQLREFQVERVWVECGVLGNAFAVRGNEVVHMQGKRLATTSLVSSSQPEPTPVSAQDENGNILEPGAERYADVAARGSSFVVNTGDAVYALCD